MEEWKEYKLGDVCSNVCSGGTPSSKHFEYYDGNIPWLNTKEINFNRIYVTEKCITEEGYNNSSAKWVVENTVIVAMYGATAGKTAVAKIPLTTNQACCNLTINPQLADYRFVYYHLCNKFVELASLANGGAQQNLNSQIIKEFPVFLPSLSEQKKIADVFSVLDDKIEVNRRINENLEAQAQALFKSWFVDFEPFKDGEFVESELGMIPKGWRVGKLGELCQFKRGKGLLSKNAIPGDVPVVAGGLEPACYHNASNTKAPVITVSGSGANAGYMRMYHQEVWASDCSFIDVTCENYLFVYCFLAINSHLLRHAQTGAVQPHVKPADIHDFDLVIPSQEAIQSFQNAISSFISEKGLLEQESRRLASLRDTLLPKLMSGQIKV